MGVAFRELPVGRSQRRQPQSRDRGLQGSAHRGYAFMGLTSCRRITIAKTLAHRRRECAIDIKPTALSLSNAPPTATSAYVIGRETSTEALRRTATPTRRNTRSARERAKTKVISLRDR